MTPDLSKLTGLQKLADILLKATGMKRKFDMHDFEYDRFRIEHMANTINDATTKGAIAEYSKDGVIVKSNPDFFRVINAMPESNQWERAEKRIAFQKLNGENNIEQAVKAAAEQLEKEEQVSVEDVDPTWLNRWFKIVEDVSDEEMQKLWGRILAGEIKQPKSFSLRTVGVISNLRAIDAEIIQSVLNFGIRDKHTTFLFRDWDVLRENQIHDAFIFLMQEVGVVHTSDDLYLSYNRGEVDGYHFSIGKETIIVRMEEPLNENIKIPIYSLTRAGEEIFTLLKPQTPDKYITSFMSYLTSKGVKAEVVNIQGNDDGRAEYGDAKSFSKD